MPQAPTLASCAPPLSVQGQRESCQLIAAKSITIDLHSEDGEL